MDKKTDTKYIKSLNANRPFVDDNLESFISQQKGKVKACIIGKVIEECCGNEVIKIPSKYEIITYQPTHSPTQSQTYNDDIQNIEKLIKNKKMFYINKTNYKSIEEILKSKTNVLEQFCYDMYDSCFYATKQFFDEIEELFRDINIVQINRKINRKTNPFHSLIESIHPNAPVLIQDYMKNNYDYQELHTVDGDRITPIEHAIKLWQEYNSNANIKNLLLQIIIELSKYPYKRPPIYYANYLMIPELDGVLSGIESFYGSVYGSIYESKNDKINNKKKKYKSVSDINTDILIDLINNNTEHAIDYIKYVNYDLEYLIMNKTKVEINDKNMRSLLKKLQSQNIPILRIILFREMIDLIDEQMRKIINDEFIYTIIPELLRHSAYIAILYLLKCKINNPDDDQQRTIIINIKEMGKTLKLFSKYNVDLINNSTFFNLISEHNPKIFLETEFINLMKKLRDNGNHINYTTCDVNGDSFLHLLTRKNELTIIKYIYENYLTDQVTLSQLNKIRNKSGETILIIAAKNNFEPLTKYLLNIITKLDYEITKISDNRGNTVYHYICMNNILIENDIYISKNRYGYTPVDYTKMLTYYKFVE